MCDCRRPSSAYFGPPRSDAGGDRRPHATHGEDASRPRREHREDEHEPQRLPDGAAAPCEARLGEHQEEAEEDELDDGAGERVDRAGGDGRGRRDPLALEEADVDRHPREVRGRATFM